jgi:hypothetical protein
VKKILHQKYKKYDLDYSEVIKIHMHIKEVVEKELNDEYLLITTPTDLSVIDGDQIVITIDAKPYTSDELLEIIEKAAQYDDLCR